MSNIKQRWAFAVAAEQEEKRATHRKAKLKPKRQGAKKMVPVSRKGKSKFRY